MPVRLSSARPSKRTRVASTFEIGQPHRFDGTTVMKQLFQVLVLHAAPQDKHCSIQTYLVADSDEDVYEWIKSEPIEGVYVDWDEKERGGEVFEVRNDDFDLVGTESFKERIIRLRGEMFEEFYDFSVAYEGVTLYGWKRIGDVTSSQIATLQELGIAHVA